MDDIQVKEVEQENPKYEILVAVEDSGVFDADGNNLTVYQKEEVDEDYLLRQKDAITADRDAQIAAIDSKLAAIAKLKGK